MHSICNCVILSTTKGERNGNIISMNMTEDTLLQYTQRVLARNHSGPTSVKSTKRSAKFKKKSMLTPRNAQEKLNTVLSLIYYKTSPKHRHRRLDAAK